MLVYFYVQLLMLAGFGLAMWRRSPAGLQTGSLLPLGVAFVTIFVASSDQLAQDRHQYYLWYQNARDMLAAGDAPDSLFTRLLDAFPARLQATGFGILLSTALYAAMLALLGLLVRRGIAPWPHAALIALCAVSDRLFMDAAFNTTRSSLAVVLFLIALVVRPRTVGLLVALAAFGIHGRVTGLLSLLLLLSLAAARFPRLLTPLLLAGVGAFLARLVADVSLLPDTAMLDLVLADVESESVRRGIVRASALTPSLAVQVGLSLLLPAALLLQAWRRMPAAPRAEAWRRMPPERRQLLCFALCALGASLLLYPDVALIQRLFVAPILLLPAFLPWSLLRRLVTIKFIVILLILPTYF